MVGNNKLDLVETTEMLRKERSMASAMEREWFVNRKWSPLFKNLL
jgi:hypothetical protein